MPLFKIALFDIFSGKAFSPLEDPQFAGKAESCRC